MPSEALEGPQDDEQTDPGVDTQGVDSVTVQSTTAPVEALDFEATSEVTPPPGRIIGPNDPIEFDATPSINGTVTPTEDVYRRIVPRRARRPIFIQVVHKGVPVPVNTGRFVRSTPEL